jgi:hypothetical protein
VYSKWTEDVVLSGLKKERSPTLCAIGIGIGIAIGIGFYIRIFDTDTDQTS